MAMKHLKCLKYLRACWAIGICLAGSAQAQDPPLTGRKVITLSNAAGEQVRLGHVDFEARPNGRTGFAVTLDASRFEERFLAMRPFKCMTGPTQRLCHFPYGNEHELASGDWTALEYQLMFLRTAPASPHLNPRNGIYYRLRATPRGLAGMLYDVDMDPIITPQGDRRRPIKPQQLEAADPRSHWLPVLTIE